MDQMDQSLLLLLGSPYGSEIYGLELACVPPLLAP